MLVLIPLGIVLGVLQMLAVRYAMIEDRSWSESISAAWAMIRTRFKDVALMWLLLVADLDRLRHRADHPGAGVRVPDRAIGARRSCGVPMAIVVALMAVVLMTVVAAGFNTFHSAAWTVFWRQATGREPGKLPAWQPAPGGWPPAPGYTPYPPQPGYPQPGTRTPPYPPQPGYPQQPYPQYPPAAPPPAPRGTTGAPCGAAAVARDARAPAAVAAPAAPEPVAAARTRDAR